MERAEYLVIIEQIFGCNAQEAGALIQLMRKIDAAPTTSIAMPGDPATECHFVLSGTVGLRALSLEGTYAQVSVVEPGEAFGAYPQTGEYVVEAYAQDSVEMLVIGTNNLRQLAGDYASIGSGLAALYAQQFTNMLERVSASLTLSAEGRVCARLLELADHTGTITAPPTVTQLALSAQTARETASRSVSKLERRGIIARNKTQWIIKAPRMLEDQIV